MDLLSTALDESGITGCDLETDTESALRRSNVNPGDDTHKHVDKVIDNDNGVVSSVDLFTNDNEGVASLDQVDLFTNALKHMEATSHLQPIRAKEADNSLSQKSQVIGSSSPAVPSTTPCNASDIIYHKAPCLSVSKTLSYIVKSNSLQSINSSFNSPYNVSVSTSLSRNPHSVITNTSTPRIILNAPSAAPSVNKIALRHAGEAKTPGNDRPLTIRVIKASSVAPTSQLPLSSSRNILSLADTSTIKLVPITSGVSLTPRVKSNFAVVTSNVVSLSSNKLSSASINDDFKDFYPIEKTLQHTDILKQAVIESIPVSYGLIQDPQQSLVVPSIPTITSKDTTKPWPNSDAKYKDIIQSAQKIKNEKPEVDDYGEELEELGHAETYFNYVPQKLKLGEKHPDPVVETSSLSSVESPNISYRLSIPEEVIDCGELSALQLEAIVYACQRHEIFLPCNERSGFLIGDGAGVGKGRTIAGIIYENYLLGRKRSIWLSVSSDLKVDAERDLKDIGAGKIEVFPLNKFKYAKINSRVNGSVKKGVIFATYSSLIGESHSDGKYRTRLKQLLHWCGSDFDGLIIFDECHKAKNLVPVGSTKPTKTGKTVLDLQKKLPNARVIYASATGAAEPKNMAYMTRLGLWGKGTPFLDFSEFIQAVEKRGVGAMELVAMEMKLRSMYIARQLSFHGVTFRVEEIPLSKDFIKIYNESVKLWIEARDKFKKAADIYSSDHKVKKTMWSQFWSAHQRFFKFLCISAKVEHCVKLARESVKHGKCVVIGLQSTGEARTLEQLEEMGGDLNDFVSTARGVFQTLIDKHFPTFNDVKAKGLFTDTKHDLTLNQRRKRKPVEEKDKKSKRVRRSSDSSLHSTDGSDSDESNAHSVAVSDFSSSDQDEDYDSCTDSFNPFAGSDSDEDPWLKKYRSTPVKPSKSKLSTEIVKKKERKDKEVIKDNKTNKDDDDFDAKFDRSLTATNLLSKIDLLTNINKDTNGFSKFNSNSQMLESVSSDELISMKLGLLRKLNEIGDRLPPNTLDELIDDLGGPENVAEMTGRKGRVVSTDVGISYELRRETDVPLEYLNLIEKQRFMDGEKNIAIISEAASSGISLQSDRRVINQRRRVHITLELPWSADRAIQQFGRTHRSNQVNAPEYIFLISELAGEQRFASTVAKRLESLGALTHGDRRATESRDLSRFNFDNKYGRRALELVMKSVISPEYSLVPVPEDYKENFFSDMKEAMVNLGLLSYADDKSGAIVLEKDYNSISKFLNRILGMTVDLQNAVFQYFSDTLTAVILEAKRSGQWDLGILDVGSGNEKVHKVETKIFHTNDKSSTDKTQLYTVSVERGLSWEAAIDLWRQYSGSDDGFYLTQETRNSKHLAVLVIMAKTNNKKDRLYLIYRPNTGLQPSKESLVSVRKKYRKVYPEVAQYWWESHYHSSLSDCLHYYWKGNCKNRAAGLSCEIGLRLREYHILGGSVLNVWSKVEDILASSPRFRQSKMQIIRLRTNDGQRIVGSLIPPACIPALTAALNGSREPSIKSYGVSNQELQYINNFPLF